MFTLGSQVTKGTRVTVAGTDILYYHDIGGYVQEYDVNDLSALAPADYDLVTNEQTLARSTWQETINQGFKPFYVEAIITSTGENTNHIKVTEHHGLAVQPTASVGHQTFQPYIVGIWAIAVIVAIVVFFLNAVLTTYQPSIWKNSGLSPGEVAGYFSPISDTVIKIAVVAAVGVVGYVLIKDWMKGKNS